MTNSSGDLKYYFEMSKVDMKIFGMKFGHVIFHAISKSCVDRVDRFYLEGPRDEPSGESAGWRTQAMLLRERQPTRFRDSFFAPRKRAGDLTAVRRFRGRAAAHVTRNPWSRILQASMTN
ncbi:hypothetical protein [Mesorhizobium sp. L-8-10]|uniref:hypothetical protein n=1 Tax=Mesorhizobium sp. L-8-10 TaxID=2744523 RepID=UPI001AEF3AAB|nr:hypothetical protein [Mesorhizobium sp. L-8-10]